MATSMARILREKLHQNKLIMAPGAYDGISARLVEEAGFPALYLTGAGVASSRLGMPDIGLLTLPEMMDTAKNIVNSVNIPVICDIDTGYGNALNLMRAVRESLRTGLAAVQIEDQITPKRCGHISGKQLVDREEMVKKIRAAVRERGENELVLIARTDAIAVHGFEDAIDRGRAYVEAGADVLFVEAPTTVEQMRSICCEFKGVPLLVNIVEGGGKTPCLSARELQEMGYRMAIYPVAAWVSAIKAIRDTLAVLKAEGTTFGRADQMVSFKDMFELVGLSSCVELEKEFL